MVHCSEWLHYALAGVETRDAVVFSLHLVPPSSTRVALVCTWNGQGQYLQFLHLHLYYIAICSFAGGRDIQGCKKLPLVDET